MNAYIRVVTFVLPIFLCMTNAVLPQKGIGSNYIKNTYVLLVPSFIELGAIHADTRSTKDSSTISFVFTFYRESPHYLIDAGFSLDVKKQAVTLSLTQFKHLNMYQLMDSLKVRGRGFLRQNIFYSQLPGDLPKTYRPTIGYYIYAQYPSDDN